MSLSFDATDNSNICEKLLSSSVDNPLIKEFTLGCSRSFHRFIIATMFAPLIISSDNLSLDRLFFLSASSNDCNILGST